VQFRVTGGDTYTKLGTGRTLKDADPTVIQFYPSGEVFALGSSNGSVDLYTKDCIYIGPIQKYEDWVWGVSVNAPYNVVVSGTSKGALKAHQVVFPMVHGLYKDRYAYRDQLTDVIIQHLVTDTRVRIRCRDYVKKIALFKERLAVLLTDKIVLYGVSADDEFDMKYKALKKVVYKGECSLMITGYSSLLICFERKIKLIDFSGKQEQEWNFDSFIRYAKLVGGPPGREIVLVALRNGEVFNLFVDNPFPVQLIKIPSAVRCTDISCDKTRLAVVDDHLNLFVYKVETKDVLYQDTKVTSVAFNSELDDVLAFSKEDNVLLIKTGDFPAVSQKLTGIIVGFKNSKVFVLQGTVMNTIDVPQSGTLLKFVECKAFGRAYQIGCLGITEQDWEYLGFEAIIEKQFEIARKAFTKLKDLKYIDLVNNAERQSNAGESDAVIRAEILAYQGNYNEAANVLVKADNYKRAMELYVELDDWDKVNEIIELMKKKANKDKDYVPPELIKMQAESAMRNDNYKLAAELYVKGGYTKEAIDACGNHGMLDFLNKICKELDKQRDEELIRTCVKYFVAKGSYGYAKEGYLRLGDMKGLVELCVTFKRWNEGLYLVKQNPTLNSVFYVPYAGYLTTLEKYDQAQECYKRASRLDLTLKILGALANNAIMEKRFKDGAYYHWKQALESLREVKSINSPSAEEVELLRSYARFRKLAHIYYAYDLVIKYLEEPFQDVIGGITFSSCAFNAACYILNIIGKETPPNISRIYLYYTVGKLGGQQEAYWTARNAFEVLKTAKIPAEWQSVIDLEALKIKAKPLIDKEGISPICNRCMNSNHFVTGNDDACTFCGHPFLRSFISFETVPLVEFQLHPNLTHAKAMELIKADHPSKKRNVAPQ
jgi:intraflagellar transport protein 122